MSARSQPVAIVALAAEARTLRDRRPDLQVRVSGPGQDAARRCARAAIESIPPWVMSWGVAGSLDANWRPGTIVRPREVVTDSGETYACTGAACTGAQPAPVRIASIEAPVRTRSARCALAARTGAVAVDMESAAIAAVCHAAGIPFCCVRAIADASDVELPAWIDAAMHADGRLAPGRVVRHLFDDPGAIPTLLRAGLGFRRALGSLTREARLGSLP